AIVFCASVWHRRPTIAGNELFTRSLSCGDDFVEALITAQIIPARIQEEIAVCRCQRVSWDYRNFFELLEGAVALACPCVNQCQNRNVTGTIERVLGNRQEIDRVQCLADRLCFSAKPGIKCRNFRQVVHILGLIAEFGFHFLSRGCKRCQGLLFIAARTRNLSLSPIRRPAEGVIRILRRNSSNHPVRRVVISRVKGGLKSWVPNPTARTILRWHLLQERLSRPWITLR